MTETKYHDFAGRHRPGTPIILVNIWDVGSAIAMARAGAPAIATGSESVAAAMGADDGQHISFAALRDLTAAICAAVEVPVTIDMEAGYADDPDEIAANAAALQDAGAVGINLEDTVVGTSALRASEAQAARIAAVRARVGSAFFINARCDAFLRRPPADHNAALNDAVARAGIYGEAGASGLFVPGLFDLDLFSKVAAGTALPVNAMVKPGGPNAAAFAKVGAGRISHGPFPYHGAMAWLTDQWHAAQL